MGLLDHDRAISALTDLYDMSVQANGTVALVSGATGSGKTTLVQALTERAAAAGAISLTATASHIEHALQLGVIAQLLRSTDLLLRVVQYERGGVAGFECVLALKSPARRGRAGLGVQGVAGMLSLSR